MCAVCRSTANKPTTYGHEEKQQTHLSVTQEIVGAAPIVIAIRRKI